MIIIDIHTQNTLILNRLKYDIEFYISCSLHVYRHYHRTPVLTQLKAFKLIVRLITHTFYNLVHTAYSFFSDVSEFFFILRVVHHLDALHGGVLVLVGQQLGLSQSL